MCQKQNNEQCSNMYEMDNTILLQYDWKYTGNIRINDRLFGKFWNWIHLRN